jgi:DNA polymerase (family 10)
MDKHEVAQILDEIGSLLELQGENRFKVRAYKNAAHSIDTLTEDLATLVKEKRLEEISGIGSHMSEKITALVKTGKLAAYTALKKEIPLSLLELLKIPGLGPKKVKLLRDKLGVESLADLTAACKAGKVANLSGFSKKTEAALLAGIVQVKTYSKRILWCDAELVAEPILKILKKIKGVERAEIAGSFRRKLETVGDLDFVVSSAKPKSVIDAFTTMATVTKVIEKGTTRATVRLKGGVQADLRVVEDSQFACTLYYFTGSKEHTVKVRQRANKMGYSLSEYGLKPLKKKIPTEEALLKLLKLPNIPPELREDRGELTSTIPTLIEESDIRGVFHCHTTESDGDNTLEEMAAAAQARGWEYIGISDHSKSSRQANGLSEARLMTQVEQIRLLNRSKKYKIHIFAGLECDILPSGKLDFPDSVLSKLDFVIASIHSSFALDEATMTARIIRAVENPHTTMLGHLTGRLLLSREPYKVNVSQVIDACIANGVIIELNGDPHRLDMDWRLWRAAAEKGLVCSINPDAHHIDGFDNVRTGVNAARKGWLTKQNVLNTLSLSQLLRKWRQMEINEKKWRKF